MISAVPLRAGDRVVLRGDAVQMQASVVRVWSHLDEWPAAFEDAQTFTLGGCARALLQSPGVYRVALVVVGARTPLFMVDLVGVWRDVERNPIAVTPLEAA